MARFNSMVATRNQINKMLSTPKHGLTNELLTESINEGFELAYAEFAAAYVSIIVKKHTPVYDKVWKLFSDYFEASVGSDENEYAKLYFALPYSNSLALSLDYFVMPIFDEIVSGELEVRLENIIGEI